MDRRALDQLLHDLAAVQHALVGRDQLRAEGVSREAVANRLGSPSWESPTPRVLRLAGSPRTDEQRAMAAVLDAGEGAVLSHASAATLWGLPGFTLRRIELSRPRSATHRRTELAVVHHPRCLPGLHCTVRAGIPVTRLARTVVDLAGTEHTARVELALHAAVRLGMPWAAVEQTLEDLAARGRKGVGVARALVLRDRGRPPLGSGLEGTVLRLLRAAGIPEPRRQVDVGGAAWIGRVDYLFDDVPLVLEIDGTWHHDWALAARHDQRRTAALEAAGFRVLRLPEELIRRTPEKVAPLVFAARQAAAAVLVPKTTAKHTRFRDQNRQGSEG